MSSTDGNALNVLFKDAWCIAVWKPAGVPVQPDTTGDRDLLSMMRSDLREPAVQLVHRIDRPVSGVVLFARDADALPALHAIFRDRGVEKIYWAIVEGKVDQPEAIVLEHTLQHDAQAHKARVMEVPSRSPSRSRVRSISNGDRYTLVEVMPVGGAFHQIRAQLAAWGHPIKGDVKYGARRGEKDRSIALHARSICFKHPITHAEVRIEAPAPSSALWPSLLKEQGI